jgi:hypothetical protein
LPAVCARTDLPARLAFSRLCALRFTGLLARAFTGRSLGPPRARPTRLHPAFHLLAQALGLRQRLFERLAVLVAGSLWPAPGRLLNLAQLVAQVVQRLRGQGIAHGGYRAIAAAQKVCAQS